MIIYTFRPPILSLVPSLLIYFIIFVVSYVAMAWYDYYYACSQLPLQKSSGGGGFTSYFKPPVHEPTKQIEHTFTQIELDKNNKVIFAMHLLLIVPILLFIGIKSNKTPKQAFYLLIVLAVFTGAYHGFRLLAVTH
jgi:hypothetical protein